MTALRVPAGRRGDDGLPALAEELGDLGFSWRDVARTAGITPQRLRQWREGAPAHSGNRERVATLVAFCEMVRREHRINDVAGWLETPVSPEAPVTGMDLVVSDRFDLVLHLAAGGGDDAEAVLEEFDPGWRLRYASDAEVFTAPDGLPGLRLRHATS